MARDTVVAPSQDASAAAVMPAVEAPPVEPAIEEPAAAAAEPVAIIEIPTEAADPQIADAVDEPSVSQVSRARDVPPEPTADDGRSPQPARDWLLARMEQAAAAHVGLAPAHSERLVDTPSIADRVQEIRPAALEPTPPPPPPPPPPVYEPPQPTPLYETPVDSQPVDAAPPPAYRAPEPQSDPVAAVASADETLALHGYHETAPSDLAPPVEAPRNLRSMAWRAGRYAAYVVGGYLAFVLALILVYRFVDPPASTLMVYEGMFGAGARQTWVPLDRISPNLVRAVIVAEDGRFCSHHGIDFAAIGEAIENADDGIPRGASTISMQVTKNLFLWQSKSYIRKLIELPLTLIIEVVWPKSRVLEIYLNIAEWGPGVFGAEAAAQHHFNRSAATLSEREAAQLAAALPNPILRDAGDPGPRLQRKAAVIQNRARASGDVVFCVKSSR